jgi:hypothetical protein
MQKYRELQPTGFDPEDEEEEDEDEETDGGALTGVAENVG